jgi:chromosome segregation ATPase
MSEKYLNYYLETMTGIMQDAVLRNISLQANERITNEVIQEQQKKIDELNVALENSNKHSSDLHVELHKNINDLRNELSEANRIKNEYENVKHQVHHVDTFRNELMKEREEHQKTRDNYELKIQELNNKIDYLQLTPAKRKKIDDAKLSSVTETKTTVEEIVEDGGKF